MKIEIEINEAMVEKIEAWSTLSNTRKRLLESAIVLAVFGKVYDKLIAAVGK